MVVEGGALTMTPAQEGEWDCYQKGLEALGHSVSIRLEIGDLVLSSKLILWKAAVAKFVYKLDVPRTVLLKPHEQTEVRFPRSTQSH